MDSFSFFFLSLSRFLSRHLSLLVTALYKSSIPYQVSVHCERNLFVVGRAGMSMRRSSLENVDYEFVLTPPAYLFRLSGIVSVMRGKEPDDFLFVVCCVHIIFQSTPSILCGSHLAFSSNVTSESKYCNHIIVSKRL